MCNKGSGVHIADTDTDLDAADAIVVALNQSVISSPARYLLLAAEG